MSQKLEAPRWKLLSVKTARGAPYNPQNRVERKKLRALTDSMRKLGLLYPILVQPDNTVIDGHRRLAAARELSWDTIPAIVVEQDADTVYASVNSTAARMSGTDALSVWLARGTAVSNAQAKLFGEMREKLGIELVKKIAEAGLSSRVYLTACRVVRYCGLQGKEPLQQVVIWLIETAVIGQVMKAMERGIEQITLRKAINTNKPLEQ